MELEHFGDSEASRMAGNLGTAMLFEAVSARAGRSSSAAAEMRKIIGVSRKNSGIPPAGKKST